MNQTADRVLNSTSTHAVTNDQKRSVLTADIAPLVLRALRYVEWTFLLLLTLRVSLLLLNKPLGYEATIGDYVMFAVMGIVAALSLVFPINRPLWQRLAYIWIEIFCLLITRAFSVWGLDIFLYLVLVKSCFLLRRRAVVLTAIAAGIAWQLSYARQLLSRDMYAELTRMLAAPKSLLIVDAVINSTGLYIASSLLVLSLCWTVLAERKSRHQAAQLAAEVETLAADLERTRIARDIHDSVGHTLTTLNIQLELAQVLHSQKPEQASQALDRAKNLSAQSLQDIRRAVSTMRHGKFDLTLALGDLVEQVKRIWEQTGSTVQISSHINLPELPLQVSQQLFLVVKEGLTNIQKHSNASVVMLSTMTTAETVTIQLSDNGVGFSLDEPVSGFGLQGMRERIQLLNGQMAVQSTLGKGTVIEVTIPR